MEFHLTLKLDIPQLRSLLDAVGALSKKVEAMSETLAPPIAKLKEAVARIESVEASAVALIQGIPVLISDAVAKAVAAGVAPADLAALDSLSAELLATADALGAAVTAGTPAAPVVVDPALPPA